VSDNLRETRAPGHGALVYSGQEDFAAAAADFLGAGRAARAEMFIAATDENLAAFSSLIDGYGEHVKLTELARQGADPGRIFGQIRMFADRHPGRPVRCWQDVGWPGRSEDEIAEAFRYEALFGRAFAGSATMILCSYDLRAANDTASDVELVHSSVLRGGSWRPCHHAGATPHDAWTGPALRSPPGDAVQLTFREDQAYVRRFAVAWARGAGLAASRVADLMIAAGELTANTLVHTEGPGTFAIWVAEDQLVFQVSDTGCIADPLAGTFRPAPTAPGSRRGLWLVHQIGDLVQTRTGQAGTTTRVHMHLRD